MRRRRRVQEVADAISEGHQVDWASLEKQSRPEERAALRHLQGLIALTGHRPRGHERTDGAAASRPARWLALLICGVASIQALLALASFAAGAWAGSLAFPTLLQGSAIAALSGCAAVLVRFGHDTRAFNLAAVLVLLASAASQPFIARFSDLSALSPLVRGLYPDAFLPWFMWAFVREFPRVLRFSRTDVLCGAATLAGLAAGVTLSAANAALVWLPALAGSLNLEVLRRGGTSLYWGIVFSLTALAVAMMLVRIRHAGASERRRVAAFLTGLAAGMAPVLLIVALELSSEAFDEFTSRHLALVDAVIYASVLSIPVTTTYAVLVQRVLVVRVLIRRTMRYGLARQTLLTAALAAGAFLAHWIFTNRHLTVGELLGGPEAGAALGVAGGALLLLRVRTRLSSYLERRYFLAEGDLGAQLGSFADAVGHARDHRHAAELVEHAVERALQVSGVELYRAAEGGFVPVRGLLGRLDRSSALASLMDASHTALDLTSPDLRALLPSPDRAWVEDNQIAVLAPIGEEDRLHGFVAVGPKRSEAEFSSDALTFLSTVAAATGLALSRLGQHVSRDRADASRDEEPAAECDACGTLASPDALGCACGGALRSAPLPRLVAAKFRVTARLGAGGMGIVYRATDQALGREVALKTLPRLTSAAAEALSREAQSMARAHHQGLATIHGVERWRGTPILVIELLEGGTLAARLSRGPLELDDAVRIVAQVVGSLNHLHAQALLHRDVKPSNIGFTRAGQVKLLDFGLAAALSTGSEAGVSAEGDERPFEDVVAGTPLYLPPEAFEGTAAGEAFDLWASAMVLYESIAGCHPLAADRPSRAPALRVRRRPLPDIRAFRPDCPAPLSAFLARTLAASPGDRFPTAEAFIHGLSGASPASLPPDACAPLLRNPRFGV